MKELLCMWSGVRTQHEEVVVEEAKKILTRIQFFETRKQMLKSFGFNIEICPLRGGTKHAKLMVISVTRSVGPIDLIWFLGLSSFCGMCICGLTSAMSGFWGSGTQPGLCCQAIGTTCDDITFFGLTSG